MPSSGGNRPGPTIHNPAHLSHWQEREAEQRRLDEDRAALVVSALLAFSGHGTWLLSARTEPDYRVMGGEWDPSPAASDEGSDR